MIIHYFDVEAFILELSFFFLFCAFYLTGVLAILSAVGLIKTGKPVMNTKLKDSRPFQSYK